MIFKSLIIFSIALINCKAEYHLVWEDNFDGNALKLDHWKYEVGSEGWGNNELQYYTEGKTKNVRVENGHLVIEAHPENVGGKQFTSGRLNSKHSWIQGKFETRAKLPHGKGLWPAIWLLPDEDTYGSSPASGEIDIMESRGQRPDSVEATIHYGGPYPNNSMAGSDEVKFTDMSKDFHIFGLEWDSREVRWSVDGKVYFQTNIDKDLWSHKGKNPYTKNGQPFDKPFFFLLNVAVGGDFFPVDPFGEQVTPEEAKHWPKPTFEVDYVRVYQQK